MKRCDAILCYHSTLCKFTTVLFALLLTLPIDVDASGRMKKDKSAQSRAISGHSIELNGIGLAYSYERAFAPRGTVVFSAGSSYSYGLTLGLEMNSINRV